jgi:DNA-binding LytR/AlgR family response regulator
MKFEFPEALMVSEDFIHYSAHFIHFTIFRIFASSLSFYLCCVMLKKYLVISTATDLVRIAPDKIVYISSDGNYCNLVQADNESRLLTFQLGQIENMICDQLGTDGDGYLFIRIGRGLIINRNYIYYINIQSQKLILSDVARFTHTVSASKEALKKLKDLMEKEAKG